MTSFSRTRVNVPIKPGTPVARPPKPAPYVPRVMTPSTPRGASLAPAPAPVVPKTVKGFNRKASQRDNSGALGKFGSGKSVGSTRTTKAKGGMGLGAALKSDFKTAKSSIGGAIKSATKSITGGRRSSSKKK